MCIFMYLSVLFLTILYIFWPYFHPSDLNSVNHIWGFKLDNEEHSLVALCNMLFLQFWYSMCQIGDVQNEKRAHPVWFNYDCLRMRNHTKWAAVYVLLCSLYQWSSYGHLLVRSTPSFLQVKYPLSDSSDSIFFAISPPLISWNIQRIWKYCCSVMFGTFISTSAASLYALLY